MHKDKVETLERVRRTWCRPCSRPDLQVPPREVKERQLAGRNPRTCTEGTGREEAGGLAVPPTAPTELGTNRCSKSATEGEIYCSVNYFKENDKNSRAENGV